MPDRAADPAVADDLRRASRDAGARAHALDGGARRLLTARNGLAGTAGVLVGPAGERFQAVLTALHEAFLLARTAHEEVADALHRVAGPVEAEQEARKVLEDARHRLAEAGRELAAEQAGVVRQEKAAALATAAGAVPAPVDRSALVRAEHEVEEAEQAVRRAAHRHEEAERARERAVRALAVACRGAGAALALPSVAPPSPPGAPGSGATNVLFGPRLQDEVFSRDPRDLGRRRTKGAGLSAQERRRLARNGLSPRTPLFSLLYGSAEKDASLLGGETRTKGRSGELGAEYALGHASYKASGGVGAVGGGYGVAADFAAEAYALKAKAHAKLHVGPAEARTEVDVRAGGAEVSGGLGLHGGPHGFEGRAEAEAFAGVKAGIEQKLGALGFEQTAGMEGQAGIGGSVGMQAGYDGGKLKFSASLGAALGLGFKVRVGGEVDVPEIAHHAKDGLEAAGKAVKSLGGLFS
ncbi:hypothetical protein [Streptosporangium carneum]|uniref:Uncharacterized protein n=1 Tax=Streptosporangium carneum TaxID=47481 RepID=A0A9W6I4C0_9ACTN|nr:hypothetical protein [Streptosporangium carneum]GLK11837.1 hypothetical protein GCM10017600_52450 [Streptosporangium carneum]